MSSPGGDPNFRIVRALALASQLGFTVSVPIVAGVLLGTYLDERTNSYGLLLVGSILLGVAAGIYGAWRLLTNAMGK